MSDLPGDTKSGISMIDSDARRQMTALLPRLRRFALVLSRSPDAADDLVQASFERGLTKLEQWQSGTRLDRWMFQIMKTVWLNSHRAAKLRQTENIDDEANQHAADGVATAHSRLTLAEVRVAFKRLPEEQQQALLLVAVEGYTYSEASELLGVPIGTVANRLARGRAALMADPSATQTNVTFIRQRT